MAEEEARNASVLGESSKGNATAAAGASATEPAEEPIVLEKADLKFIKEHVYRVHWREDLTTWAPKILVPMIIDRILEKNPSQRIRRSLTSPKKSEAFAVVDKVIRRELYNVRTKWKKHIAMCAQNDLSTDVIWEEFPHHQYTASFDEEFWPTMLRFARIAYFRNALDIVGMMAGAFRGQSFSADRPTWHTDLDEAYTDTPSDEECISWMCQLLVDDILHWRWDWNLEASEAILKELKEKLGEELYNKAGAVAMRENAQRDLWCKEVMEADNGDADENPEKITVVSSSVVNSD